MDIGLGAAVGAAVVSGGFQSDEGKACGGDQEAGDVGEFVLHGEKAVVQEAMVTQMRLTMSMARSLPSSECESMPSRSMIVAAMSSSLSSISSAR